MARGRVSKEKWAALKARAAAVGCTIVNAEAMCPPGCHSSTPWLLVTGTGEAAPGKNLPAIEPLIAEREAANDSPE